MDAKTVWDAKKFMMATLPDRECTMVLTLHEKVGSRTREVEENGEKASSITS